MGQWRKVVEKMEIFSSKNTATGNKGYSYVLVLKSFAFQGMLVLVVRLPLGMAYEGLEELNLALEDYLHASDFIQATQPQILHYSVQYWISKILSRLCILSLRLQDPTRSLKHFRVYKCFMDANRRTNLSTHEQLMVYHWYWRTLSGIVRKRVEQNMADHTTPNDDNRDGFHGSVDKRLLESRLTFYELKDELLEAQHQYEMILMDYTQFPRAGRVNRRYYLAFINSHISILEFVDLAMENWRLLGSDPVHAKELAQVHFLEFFITKGTLSRNSENFSVTTYNETSHIYAYGKWELCRCRTIVKCLSINCGKRRKNTS
jgi:hypothetical protein